MSGSRAAYLKAWHERNPGKQKAYREKSDALRRGSHSCLTCGKDHDPFDGVRYCSDRCRNAARRAADQSRRERYREMVSLHKTGIGCSVCGYSRCGGALDWHHTDSNKERRLTVKTYFTPLGEAEREKCVLLCANCHREMHYAEDKKMQANGEVFV